MEKVVVKVASFLLAFCIVMTLGAILFANPLSNVFPELTPQQVVLLSAAGLTALIAGVFGISLVFENRPFT